MAVTISDLQNTPLLERSQEDRVVLKVIIEARSQSFIGPDGPKAPGLGNNTERVQADQQRLVNAVLEQTSK